MADVETFATTLYLLRAADDLRTLIRRDYLDDGRTRTEDAQVAGHAALLLMRSTTRDDAHWTAPLTQLSGVAIGRQGSISPSAALLIAVDDHVFALTHGHSGRWIVEDDAKEHLFGLRVAIRVLEPAKVRQLTRLALDVSARVDRSVVPAGQEVRGFGVEQYAQIVNQIGGRTTELDLTHSRRSGVPLRLEGADALRIRLGTEPASCIADLRTLAATLTREPVAELAFIERIRRLRPDRVRRLPRLQRQLGQLLQPGADGPIGLAVPIDHIDDEEAGLTYRVVAGDLDEHTDELDLETLRRAVAGYEPEERPDILRRGRVHTVPDDDRRRPSRADRWIVAEITDGTSRLVFQQGDWYEITGQEYLDALAEDTRRIFDDRLDPPLTLPAWTTRREDEYLKEVAQDSRFLVLDQNLVTSRTQPGGFEACDLLGPHNELIHVKGTRSSAPLSHLFNQGLVAADTFCADPAAWAAFKDKVHDLDPCRNLGDRPAAVVFGIHLKTGRQLTPDSLFTFARVALVRAHQHIKHRLRLPVAIAVIP